jgi:hypothetical protein
MPIESLTTFIVKHFYELFCHFRSSSPRPASARRRRHSPNALAAGSFEKLSQCACARAISVRAGGPNGDNVIERRPAPQIEARRQ